MKNSNEAKLYEDLKTLLGYKNDSIIIKNDYNFDYLVKTMETYFRQSWEDIIDKNLDEIMSIVIFKNPIITSSYKISSMEVSFKGSNSDTITNFLSMIERTSGISIEDVECDNLLINSFGFSATKSKIKTLSTTECDSFSLYLSKIDKLIIDLSKTDHIEIDDCEIGEIIIEGNTKNYDIDFVGTINGIEVESLKDYMLQMELIKPGNEGIKSMYDSGIF